jgi:ABC-type spermidine/putrescine transport system permease subunit II
MLAIPSYLYESADLDGASKWQQFRYITLPQLKNTITFVLIVGTIGGLQVFAEPLTLGGNMSGGDSRQFSTLTLFLYEQAFVNNRWGYAAAIGIFITVLISILSAISLIYISAENLSSQALFIYLVLAGLCVLAAITYTVGKNAYGYRGLGDLMVFIFFGLVSVMGVFQLYGLGFEWLEENILKEFHNLKINNEDIDSKKIEKKDGQENGALLG